MDNRLKTKLKQEYYKNRTKYFKYQTKANKLWDSIDINIKENRIKVYEIEAKADIFRGNMKKIETQLENE